MKQCIYGFAGILAISVAMPGMAAVAPGVQIQPSQVIETTTTTRTIVVGETTLYGQQIAAELENRDNASMFRNLLSANGLSTSLRNNDKGYTAFVPLDSAFSGMTLPAPPAEGTINPQARALLEDHVVSGKFDVNLLHGQRDRVSALSGKPITISKAGTNYYANGHLIIDRQHSPEGIIYFIQSVIDSPDIKAAIYNPADVRK